MSSAIVDYDIDRRSAAEMLRVSVRTVDRYIRSSRLSSRHVDGRVYLSGVEVTRFRAGARAGRGRVAQGLSRQGGDNLSAVADKLSPPTLKKDDYRQDVDMSSLQEQIRVNNQKLELANYKIGQLEVELKNSVPMLRYELEKLQTARAQEKLKNDFSEAILVIQKQKRDLRYESVSKKIILLILLTTLALQPLWLLFLN